MSHTKKTASAVEEKCKDIQETLQKENTILQEMLNETENMHVVFLDRDFNFVRVNEAYAKTCGYKPDEMIGKNHFDLYPNEENEAIFRRVRDTGVPAEFHDKPFVFTDQPERGVTYWDWTLKPVKDETGEVDGLILSLVETTERKKAEEKIQNLAKFPSENPNPVLRIDKNGYFLYCNDAAKQCSIASKCKIGEVIPEGWRIFVDAAFASGKRQEFEEQIGGRTFVFIISPVTDYVNVYGHDITERKKTEEALRESEEQLRRAIEDAPIPVIMHAEDGEVLKISRSWTELTGYTINHIRSFDEWVTEAVYGEGANKVRDHLHELFRGDKRSVSEEFAIKTLHGEERFWSFNASSPGTLTDGRRYIVGMAVDITERKKAEDALVSSEKRYRRLFETSQDGIMARDLNGCMIDCNQAYAKMIGYSKEELLRLPVDELLPEKWHMQRNRIFREVLETGDSAVFEREYRRKDGVVFPASVRSWRLTDENGEIIGVWSIVRDITRRKELERKLQDYTANLEKLVEVRTMQLKDAERLATIGSTAGMVGHDIRNPLQAIVGDLYLAKSDLASIPESEEKEGLQESLAEIEKNVEYIDKIVQDLQDFARPLNPVARETDLEDACNEVLFKSDIEENVEASYEVQNEAKKLISDPDLLKRILSNLVSNAVQAMPMGGKLMIQGFKDDDAVVIMVEDTGVGIPEEVRSKLFTPLFTTKSKGQGFGLAVIKRMTEALGGSVTFESEVGKGTKFVVRFPQKS